MCLEILPIKVHLKLAVFGPLLTGPVIFIVIFIAIIETRVNRRRLVLYWIRAYGLYLYGLYLSLKRSFRSLRYRLFWSLERIIIVFIKLVLYRSEGHERAGSYKRRFVYKRFSTKEMTSVAFKPNSDSLKYKILN